MPRFFSNTDKLTRPLLRRNDAAAYIRNTYGIPCSPRWLAKLAVVGGGPVFHKAGRIPLYPPNALDSWATERLGTVHSTTNDHRLAKGIENSLKFAQRGTADDER